MSRHNHENEMCDRVITAAENESPEKQFPELVRLCWSFVPQKDRELVFRAFMGKSSDEDSDR